MSVENLVTIDFDSDGVNSHRDGENEEEVTKQNSNNFNNRNYPKNTDETTDVIFSDNNCLMDDRIANESQPLLGGLDHHEAHQIIYNQFPSKLVNLFCEL